MALIAERNSRTKLRDGVRITWERAEFLFLDELAEPRFRRTAP